jgi:diaminohydroxyphosphoribosylaminopyrimidine deaminase/5-amino-6-(5-phosphoribosylamino)uracil reductase
MKDKNAFYMARAIALAGRAAGMTSPNPVVGCVIVKNGRIVGEGYHKKAGQPHAEINALKKAGSAARGATMYVTLEPCNHFGKTPPCTDAVIRSGIRKVIAAMPDPNPVNNGKGFRKLRANGIKVVSGVMERESFVMNLPFLKTVDTGLPFVTLKSALSLDGKIAARTGDSRWISSEASRKKVQAMRETVDAVLTGIGTVLNDDPVLLPRTKRPRKLPVRVILDTGLRLPLTSNLVKTAARSKVVIVTGPEASVSRVMAFKRKGLDVWSVPLKGKRPDVKAVLRKLSGMGVQNVLAECGPGVAGSLFDGKLVDKVVFFIAPVVIGSDKAPGPVGGKGAARVSEALRVKGAEYELSGGDIMITGYTGFWKGTEKCSRV